MPSNEDYQLVMKASARKELLRLPNALASRIQQALNNLMDCYRRDVQAANVVPVAGRMNTYRLRVGDYRAVFEVDEENFVVRVFLIGHRKDIYRDL